LPCNPLDSLNTMFTPLANSSMGHSIAFALLRQPLMPLPPESGEAGAGVYALYYNGSNPLYQRLVEHNRSASIAAPIYVGKAVPKGVRVGAMASDIGHVVTSRLSSHSRRIQNSHDLDRGEFLCRYLILDWVFVGLGESLLIDLFAPVWNAVLDGFGNNPPGRGRIAQSISRWDTCHPGRGWASELTGEQRHQRDNLLAQVAAAIQSQMDRWNEIAQQFEVPSTSVVSHSDGVLFSTRRARATLARISSGFAVQV
jgi:hypothetical protein